MHTRTLWTAKRGNSREEYEDASAADIAQRRFALADGASESSFAAAWARLLVNGFVACPVPWTRRWAQWLPPLQAEWAADVDSRLLPWFAEAKREQGAFATFLGLVFVRQRWRAVAVGDCCLFQLRGDDLCQAFPVDRAAGFSTSPQLLGSRTPPAEVPRSRAVRTRGEWQPSDRFWLMSDALAQWFLRATETGEQPGKILGELVAASSPGEEFSAWIEHLRDHRAIRNDDVTPLGLPMVWSGSFADVYKLECPGRNVWAVKCFTREVPGLQQRYHCISEHLARFRIPYTVEFEYLPEGIRIRGRWYPVLKMRWVDGKPLNQLVREQVQGPETLVALRQLWVDLARRLRKAELAHADLQHENVLLVPDGNKGNSVRLRLIDYDGMFVPALKQTPSGELGHPNYQHPVRLRSGIYNVEVDRFSHLVICTALTCLIAGGRRLWDRYDNGKNLLFRQNDFANPAKSPLIRELTQTGDPQARALVGHLVLASQGPLGQEPQVWDLFTGGPLLPLTPAQEQQLAGILRRTPLSLVPIQPPERTFVGTHAGQERDDNCLQMKLCWCPAGSFTMGSPAGEPDRDNEEHQVPVTLSQGFWLGKFQVTQDQWRRIMGNNPSFFSTSDGGSLQVEGLPTDRFPVEFVRWKEVVAFCDKLTERERHEGRLPAGWRYQIPTEAQWEYACRAGTTTETAFGDRLSSRQANFDGNRPYNGAETGPNLKRTAEVGSYPPNAWGLHDMHGNVYEWCRDTHYRGLPGGNDPEVASRGGDRILRGGGWISGGEQCRSATRYWYDPSEQRRFIGFRVAYVRSSS